MFVERYRNWFITINSGAESYRDIEKILCGLKCKYFYIYHNADEDLNNDHLHLVLMYDNARSWDAVKKTFAGAHIEKCEYVCYSIQYLCHLNDIEKKQYPISDIFTNAETDLNEFMYSVDFVPFSLDDLTSRIQSGAIHNIVDCSHYYRLCDINKYRALIKDVLETLGISRYVNEQLENQIVSLQSNYQSQIEELEKCIENLRIELNNKPLF